MKIIFYIALLSFSLNTLAQSNARRKEVYQVKRPGAISATDLANNKEIYLENETVIRQYDLRLGVERESFFTMKDNHRLALALHFNSNMNNIGGATGFELTYHKRIQNFQRSFWSLIYKSMSADFSEVGENPTGNASAISTSNSFPNNKIEDIAAQTITTMGLGYSHRFKFFLDFFHTEKVFEQVNAYLAYNTLEESQRGFEYTGIGLIADYEIQYRSSEKVFYGAKFSYNISNVAREKLPGETSGDNKLNLAWLSFALQLGYYF